jgi:hypothetical protein
LAPGIIVGHLEVSESTLTSASRSRCC